LTRDQHEWERLARADPMFAIASVPGREGNWTLDDFLATGESTVAGVLEMLDGLDARGPRRRALDFGCGLGRLSRALSYRFDEVRGVDISSTMVSEAATINTDRDGCRFTVNPHPDLRDLPTGTFDLVLSLVTLQHVSDKAVIRSYIREFVRVAAPGGVIVFQLPYAVAARVRFHPRRIPALIVDSLPEAGRFVQSRARGSHTLNWLPEPEVSDLLGAARATVLAAFDDDRIGSDAVPSRMYVARAPGVSDA
jgi:SAM-dependent methyltransferase